MISHFKSATAQRGPKFLLRSDSWRTESGCSLRIAWPTARSLLTTRGHPLHWEMFTLHLINHSPFSWRCLEAMSRKKV